MSESITVREAAERLRVTPDTLYRWRAEGIPLPPGWAWDATPGRRMRLVPPPASARLDDAAVHDATEGRR